MKLGTTDIKKMFLGTTEIKKVFTGTTQVWASEDPYIYIATAQKIRKYLKSDMSYVGESPSYGGTIRALYGDDTHIYAGGYTTNRVRKYLKSTLAYVSQSDTFATIETIAGDDTHLYFGGGSVPEVGIIIRKILKSNMSTVTNSASTVANDSITRIKLDATYVYSIGGHYLTRCLKSTLVQQNQVDFYSLQRDTIRGLSVDDSNIFVSNLSPKGLFKYDKSTLSYVSNLYTFYFNDNINDIQSDASNVYAVMGGSNSKIYKFSKTSYLAIMSPTYSDTPPAAGISEAVIEGDYIYAAGGTPYKIRVYNLSNLTLARESATTSAHIAAVSL